MPSTPPGHGAFPGHAKQQLNAREAALVGDGSTVHAFTSEVLGMWSGWSEPVSTAVLGNRAVPLCDQGQLTPDALNRLQAEASAIHQQLTPVWRRKVNRSRLLLLNTPLGDGLTLHDMVPGQGADISASVAAGFDAPRLTEILAALSPAERAVTLALANPGVTTWAEAAMAGGAAQPALLGERVRRKVKRLAARSTGRSLAAEATTESGR
ncbi:MULTISPECIES: hypothetical protein [unclassified Streptomyces]|uniref:hypothetical protein n=1 Tax=unclassified Streptomyces TaxID=2593676 RepID=UPI0022543084|nr:MULTISPECIES: hypothetical protein [unclassified Streptomyces]MCX4403811.1 hypothetical protein [Streptomyces sp. NBC_01764]MCX5181238.1 hypothetical protein [Streptomyces sp. NBC_00268]